MRITTKDKDRRRLSLRGVNQDDIAKKLGITQATVSMVLNNVPKVGERTRMRVFKAIEDLDYRPHSIARSFAATRTGIIGFILCDRMISNPIYSKMLHCVEAATSKHARKLLYASAEVFISEKSKFPVMLRERMLDGVIVTGRISPEFVSILKDRRVPTVLLGNYDIQDVDTVGVECKKGVAQAVSYLFSLGHRRIGMISGSFEHYHHREVLEGYKAALREVGLNFDEALVQEDEREDAAVMVERLFRASEPPTAIFAANDMMAVNAMRALKEKGLGVPADISLVGFYDLDTVSYTTPRLTSIRVADEEMAEAAVNRLMDIIDSGLAGPVKETVNTELVIRESCGAVTRSGGNIVTEEILPEKEVIGLEKKGGC